MLSRQIRALPSKDPQPLELPALQLEVPKDTSDHGILASGNSCCLLYNMLQAPGTEHFLKLPLPGPFSESPCPGPIFPLLANLTREGGWLPTHSPLSVTLQGRYSGWM